MKIFLLFILMVMTGTSLGFEVDEIRVYKSKRKMNMIYKGEIVKTYNVMLGRGGPEAKIKEGDNKVPEGSYVIDYKNLNSKFHKSLHISYPNQDDLRRAAEMGVEPGGDIMIHGYPNRPKPLFKFLKKLGLIKLVDWTAGCVAVNNDEMDEIFASVDEETPVTILH